MSFGLSFCAFLESYAGNFTYKSWVLAKLFTLCDPNSYELRSYMWIYRFRIPGKQKKQNQTSTEGETNLFLTRILQKSERFSGQLTSWDFTQFYLGHNFNLILFWEIEAVSYLSFHLIELVAPKHKYSVGLLYPYRICIMHRYGWDTPMQLRYTSNAARLWHGIFKYIYIQWGYKAGHSLMQFLQDIYAIWVSKLPQHH